jgi:hypothetical protein
MLFKEKIGSYNVCEIDKPTAKDFIKKYHYSDTLPGINKIFLGFFNDEDDMVGVITLGYGTQPKGTISKLWDGIGVKDYLEIGRMAMTEEMPRNSESQMIKSCSKWLKGNTNIKVLFTWADGVLGKVGYVYQACSMHYAGFSTVDRYYKDGSFIHFRSMGKFFSTGEEDISVGKRPTKDQMKEYGLSHINGRQFKYLKFLCNKSEKKKLIKTCKVDLNQSYPKEKDLV